MAATPTQRVGARVRQLREALGLTQEKLAFESDLSKGHLSKLERGLLDPGVTTLSRLAERLGVGTWDLLVDPDGSPRERLIDATRSVSDDAILDALARIRALVIRE